MPNDPKKPNLHIICILLKVLTIMTFRSLPSPDSHTTFLT